jgi:RHS repeat-associated protein
MRESGTSNFNQNFDNRNRIQQPPSCSPTIMAYCYDGAGNLLNDAFHTYTFDAENRVKTVDGTAATYTYNGGGDRVRKDLSSGPSTEYFFFGSNPIAELNPATGEYTDYIFGYGRRIAKDTSSNGSAVQYYHGDHLGTTRIMTNASGSKISDCTYAPYGEEVSCSPSNAPNHYKFTGKERDTESGLDYFGARYDSSAMGRFTSPDSFYKDSHVADPQSWNEYAYTRNNPLRYVDPTGENATVSTSCSTANNKTTCNVNISASISIYAQQGSNISQQQLNQAATDMKNSIEGAWNGSFTQDGVTYNVSTQVTVSVAASEQAATSSGAQNVIGMTNGPITLPNGQLAGAYVNPKSFTGMLTGAADTGLMDINHVDNYAKHEFTHLLGTGDKPGAVLSNTDPALRPLGATSQDFGWGIREATQGVNSWMRAPQVHPMGYGEWADKPSQYSNTNTVGAPWHWWK